MRSDKFFLHEEHEETLIKLLLRELGELRGSVIFKKDSLCFTI